MFVRRQKIRAPCDSDLRYYDIDCRQIAAIKSAIKIDMIEPIAKLPGLQRHTRLAVRATQIFCKFTLGHTGECTSN
jgi:hypothetical protein